jgi:aminoglycoside phosphotransferase (APT) family kinase protein
LAVNTRAERLAAARPALESYLATAAQAGTARIGVMELLSGGAIQENWLLIVDFAGGVQDGRQELVLRTDAPTLVPVSLSRAQEFAVQSAAWQAGVTVAEPMWLCEDPAVLGQPFYVMRRVAGEALGRRVVADTSLGGNRAGVSAPAYHHAAARRFAISGNARPGPGVRHGLSVPVPSRCPRHAAARVGVGPALV